MRTYNYLALSALVLASCVEHRPTRNGLRDESIYLTKADFTAPSKKDPQVADDGWLMKVTVVKASSPNVVGDYAFPGFESDTKYVKMRFAEEKLQLVDGRQLQIDDPNNPNDDLATRTDRVVLELAGQNVDVMYQESLDGERTNLLSENFEKPWQERQKFRVDFEHSTLDPIVNMAWFYGDFLHDCARMTSANLVPGSFSWDAESETLNYRIEVNYELTVWGGCYDLVSLATGVGTATIQYHFSFHRPDPSTYTPEVIAEKAPVNKKYGAFQILNLFRDGETGLLSARSLIQRWDPARTEPVVFYFHPGFPPRFLPMFDRIKASTNEVLAAAGANMRVDFQPHDAGGVVRQFGDLRYSFVVWHQDIDTTRGLLGYGPSSADPRTGEVISANLNLYNVGMDYYRYLIQDYLEENGGKLRPDPAKAWEQTSCTPGETTAPANATARAKSTLFEEMRRVMDLPASTEDSVATADFLPTPARPNFLSDYHRTLGEFRYADPAWNAYVYKPAARHPLADLPERLKTEREFQGAMSDIIMNQNPFGGAALASQAGLDQQREFIEKFRGWKKNHAKLMADQEMLLGLKNITVFEPGDAINAIAEGARYCLPRGTWESDTEYSARIVEAVVEHVAIHEFGHNLGLRHNFYGSVDAKHMEEGEVSASVMDYVTSWEEAGSPKSWGGYDKAALTWIYGNASKRSEVMAQDFLYCTDEHRSNSALCRAHDLGVTPSQIVLNAIERYDWLYSIRNRRAFRTFWDTSGYVGGVYNSIFPMLRMWYLSIFDWGGGRVQGTLKELDQTTPGATVLTDQEYDEIAQDFYNDGIRAIGLTMAFYDAVINQPASFRDYQTDFDPFYGDILRIGIIIDKLFAMFAFMDLQEVYDYNPNVYTYVSLYDAPFADANTALSQRVLDNMLGASYDTFPWFKYYALAIFASVTNTNLVDKEELKERIAIRRFETAERFVEEYGQEALDRARAGDNPAQVFEHRGEQLVYTYLADRGWHLVSGRSRNPVSFQFMKEYNESLRAQGDDELDNYGLKILLAYYEYYNNFVGF